jgi:hypothetical protein
MLKSVSIAILLFLACAASTSLSYDLVNDVIDDGGTKMMSSGYVLRGSFGQPTIGKIASANYVAYIGFWHPYPAGPGIEEEVYGRMAPLVFSLSQNHPNPVTSSTIIKYSLAHDVKVELAVYNSAGQRIRDLVHELQEPGYYSLSWDLRDVSGEQVPNAVYFYRIVAGDYVKTRKMVILR